MPTLPGVSAGPTPTDVSVFSSWRGRNADYVLLFHPSATWDSITVRLFIFQVPPHTAQGACQNIVPAWSASIAPQRVVISLPMLPADGSTSWLII